MAMARLIHPSFLLLVSSLLHSFSGVFSATFTLVNQCSYTVWPGILSNAGVAQLPTTGLALNPGQSTSVPVPAGWAGRLWGRTLCSQDPSTGKFGCVTGDCDSGAVQCNGGGAAPPATLAEFTLNGNDGLDFYDVSLVDGYNLPMLVVPQGGGPGGNCTVTGCVGDLNTGCPSGLQLTASWGVAACKSACEAFGDPQYCCSGAYNTPQTCQPTSYSEYFKRACPRAYSYAYDDGTSTFTCASADYIINFCPTPAARLQLGCPTGPFWLTFLPFSKLSCYGISFVRSRKKDDHCEHLDCPPSFRLCPLLSVLDYGEKAAGSQTGGAGEVSLVTSGSDSLNLSPFLTTLAVAVAVAGFWQFRPLSLPGHLYY